MTATKTAEEKALEYGFRWFEFHAQQRTTTFNFYLVVYAGLAAADAFLLKEKIHVGSITISVIMIVISVLFWQLDVRNRQLINIGESILSKSWLKNGLDEALNPVSLMAAHQPESFRFKQLFGAMFILGGIAGMVAFYYSLYLLVF